MTRRPAVLVPIVLTVLSVAVQTRQRATAPPFSEADVRFMQGMIHHHGQALDMTALLPARTSRDDMKLLAKRIDISQTDEIKMMQRWLRARGQEAPDPLAHQSHDMGAMPGMSMPHAPMSGAPAILMPGMLTAEEMARLAATKGADFDRLFLEDMIKHHQGALVMVKDLFASPGAAQDGDVFAFASDVEADQKAEIDRMRRMRAEMGRR